MILKEKLEVGKIYYCYGTSGPKMSWLLQVDKIYSAPKFVGLIDQLTGHDLDGYAAGTDVCLYGGYEVALDDQSYIGHIRREATDEERKWFLLKTMS